MSDTAVIAGCALAFACGTWLLGVSYFVGRHAGRTESLERSQTEIRATVRLIFERLDLMSQHLPHRCCQEVRLAALEARIAMLRPDG